MSRTRPCDDLLRMGPGILVDPMAVQCRYAIPEDKVFVGLDNTAFDGTVERVCVDRGGAMAVRSRLPPSAVAPKTWRAMPARRECHSVPTQR